MKKHIRKRPKTKDQRLKTLLHVNNLTKTVTTDRAKKKTLLHDISLDISSGSIFALLGPNGAGKTTLIKCIMGFMKVKKGSLQFHTLQTKDQRLQTTPHIGYAPDTTQLFPYLTGYEQMKLVRDLHQNAQTNNQKLKTKDHLSSLLTQVGLEPENTTRVRNYSAGMKKRLGLAMSLVGDPEFLIRDEPMAGVDPLGRITIKNLIRQLKDEGKILLFSTHILSDVEEVADDLAIIHQGKLLHQGSMIDISGPLEVFFAQTVKK